MQEEQQVAISRVEGDLCLEDLTEDDGVSRTSQRMIHEGVSRTSMRMIHEGVSRFSITIITMHWRSMMSALKRRRGTKWVPKMHSTLRRT